MKVTIALPAYYDYPIGGFHVHYRYANLLADRGHDVTVVFPCAPTSRSQWRARLSTRIWAAKLRARNRPLVSSFQLDSRVRVSLIPNLERQSLPNADVIVATAWQTAEVIQHAPMSKGKKAYVVYDYEYWMTASPQDKQRIEATFNDRFAIVATSTAVDRMVRQQGAEPVALICCGIDFDEFTMRVPPEERGPLMVGFPAREESFKGCADAVEAGRLLIREFGDGVQIAAFGRRRPQGLDSLHWVQSPSQGALNSFYNNVAVFMLPSHFEGWGLTGVEAKACGAALVVTDNGGSGDYAVDSHNALVVPPRRPDKLAEAVATLLRARDLRERLARQGQADVSRFTWQSAADSLEAVLCS